MQSKNIFTIFAIDKELRLKLIVLSLSKYTVRIELNVGSKKFG